MAFWGTGAVLANALRVGGSVDCLWALVSTAQFLVYVFLQSVTNQDFCEHLEV